MKKRLARIVQQLSDENTQHCHNHAHAVVNYLIYNEISNHSISDPLPEIQSSTGKYGVNAIMKHIGEASNHLHSGYHHLLTSSKGYLDRITKVREILQFMEQHPTEFISWILWQRSTYANSHFAREWEVNFWYVDNLMRGVHAVYFGDQLPCFLRAISETEFRDAIDIVKRSFGDELTDSQQRFVEKLESIDQKLKAKIVDFKFIPTGWNHLKLWVDTNGFHRSWMSVFRRVLSQVYLLDYKRMINEVKTAKVIELLRIPFQNLNKKKLPYLMVSGPKYVIRRENNEKSLEKLRHQGYFELNFKFLEDKWSDAIVVRVKPSRKMRKIIHNEIELRSMILLPERSNDVDIQLIFSGTVDAFIATDHLKNRLSVDATESIGIDLNRRGEYAVVSSLDVTIPDEILKQSKRWDHTLERIQYLQSLMNRTPNSWKERIYQMQINELYQRKRNLRKDYHLRLANWVGQQLVSSGAEKLVIEDLNLRTYGTKGALAKAIESMADDTSLYAREVLAVRKFTGKEVDLQKIPAYNSSRIHVDCGGIVKRDMDNYDIAPCERCHEMVNTHKNAALYLVRSTKP
ncbi:MAG: hypothetical protein ACXADH_09775 [Candidatus Kariarchaeaceae archaeon]